MENKQLRRAVDPLAVPVFDVAVVCAADALSETIRQLAPESKRQIGLAFAVYFLGQYADQAPEQIQTSLVAALSGWGLPAPIAKEITNFAVDLLYAPVVDRTESYLEALSPAALHGLVWVVLLRICAALRVAPVVRDDKTGQVSGTMLAPVSNWLESVGIAPVVVAGLVGKYLANFSTALERHHPN